MAVNTMLESETWFAGRTASGARIAIVTSNDSVAYRAIRTRWCRATLGISGRIPAVSEKPELSVHARAPSEPWSDEHAADDDDGEHDLEYATDRVVPDDQRFHDADPDPAEERAPDAAEAADHGGTERPEEQRRPECRPHDQRLGTAGQDRADPGEQPCDHPCVERDPTDRDAGELGRLRVLRRGPARLAERAARQIPVEADDAERSDDDDEELPRSEHQ